MFYLQLLNNSFYILTFELCFAFIAAMMHHLRLVQSMVFRHADPVKVVGPVFAVDVDINDDDDGRRVKNEELD